ncbi:MAG: cytochrome c [Magnetococcus sp. WYHC-3]
MKSLYKMMGVVFMALPLAGCGGASDYQVPAGATPEQVFAAACEGCHGTGGSGKFGLFLKLAGTGDTVSEIAAKVGNGGRIMPAFSRMSETERMALAEYVKTLK